MQKNANISLDRQFFSGYNINRTKKERASLARDPLNVHNTLASIQEQRSGRWRVRNLIAIHLVLYGILCMQTYYTIIRRKNQYFLKNFFLIKQGVIGLFLTLRVLKEYPADTFFYFCTL